MWRIVTQRAEINRLWHCDEDKTFVSFSLSPRDPTPTRTFKEPQLPTFPSSLGKTKPKGKCRITTSSDVAKMGV